MTNPDIVAQFKSRATPEMPDSLRDALAEADEATTRERRDAWRQKHRAPDPEWLLGYWQTMSAANDGNDAEGDADDAESPRPAPQGTKRADKAAKQASRKAATGKAPQIYQRKNSYWIDRGDGTLAGPFVSAEVGPVLCEDHGVRDRAVIHGALIERCKVVSIAFASYMARATAYRPEIGDRGAVETATLRWRDVTPTQHADIDGWLDALGGEHAPFLRAWIAALWDLDKPAPMLYLTGGRNAGKNLFADCCASIYGAKPIEGKDAVSHFNANLATCPIVFFDEGVPDKMTLSDLRSTITLGERQIDKNTRSR